MANELKKAPLIPEVVVDKLLTFDATGFSELEAKPKIAIQMDKVKAGAATGKALNLFKSHVADLNACMAGMRKASNDARRFSLRFGEVAREIILNAEWQFDFFAEENRTFNGVEEWFTVRVGMKLPRVQDLVSASEHATKMIPHLKAAGLPQLQHELQSRYMRNQVGRKVEQAVFKYYTSKEIGMPAVDAQKRASDAAIASELEAWRLAKEADKKASKDKDATPAADRVTDQAEKAITTVLRKMSMGQVLGKIKFRTAKRTTSANQNTPAPEAEKINLRDFVVVHHDTVRALTALEQRFQRELIEPASRTADGLNDAFIRQYYTSLDRESLADMVSLLTNVQTGAQELSACLHAQVKPAKKAKVILRKPAPAQAPSATSDKASE